MDLGGQFRCKDVYSNDAALSGIEPWVCIASRGFDQAKIHRVIRVELRGNIATGAVSAEPCLLQVMITGTCWWLTHG